MAVGQAPTHDSRDELVARGQRLRVEGAYEEAALWYESALARPGGNRGSVALAAAEAHLAAGSYSSAVALARRALGERPPQPDAQIVLGEALRGLGDLDGAAAALGSVPETDPLSGYAALRAADVREAQGYASTARELRQEAFNSIGPWWKAVVAHQVGASYLEEEQPISALEWLDRALRLGRDLEGRRIPAWFDGELSVLARQLNRPSVLLAVARGQVQAGDQHTAVDRYSEIVTNHPSSSEAVRALDALDEMGISIPGGGVLRGRILYHAGRYTQAMETMSAYLEEDLASEAGATARYFYALALRDLGHTSDAGDALLEVARRHPDSPLAVEALWQRARIFEVADALSDAVQAHLVVAESYPGSGRGIESLRRAAALSLRSGDRLTNARIWSDLARAEHDPEARAAGLFWEGRRLLRGGEPTQGRALLTQAVGAAPDSYEGIRALDLLDPSPAEPYRRAWRLRMPASPSGDVAECSGWLASWVPAGTPSRAGLEIGAVERLLSVGMRREALMAGLEVASLADTRPGDAYAIGVALGDQGLYPVALLAAQRLAAASPAGTLHEAPACLQRLAYPLAFDARVTSAAAEYKLDPLLLLSLLRQESWFGSHARSGVGARGLGQIMPATGSEIARGLGRRGYVEQDLYRPQESIAFAAWYLSRQFQAFGQRAHVALAAYNGGPGNAGRWLEASPGGDADEFAERIDFRETRAYLRLIYQIYARYQALYPAP